MLVQNCISLILSCAIADENETKMCMHRFHSTVIGCKQLPCKSQCRFQEVQNINSVCINAWKPGFEFQQACKHIVELHHLSQFFSKHHPSNWIVRLCWKVTHNALRIFMHHYYILKSVHDFFQGTKCVLSHTRGIRPWWACVLGAEIQKTKIGARGCWST
jgi:hypothetical protein